MADKLDIAEARKGALLAQSWPGANWRWGQMLQALDEVKAGRKRIAELEAKVTEYADGIELVNEVAVTKIRVLQARVAELEGFVKSYQTDALPMPRPHST